MRAHADGAEVSLYVEPRALALAHDEGWLGPSDRFRACCLAAEGVSHFVYVAFRDHHEHGVSELELELQAEVDKWAMALLAPCADRAGRLLAGRGAASSSSAIAAVACATACSRRSRSSTHPGTERGDRYRVAIRLAARYARTLEDDAGANAADRRRSRASYVGSIGSARARRSSGSSCAGIARAERARSGAQRAEQLGGLALGDELGDDVEHRRFQCTRSEAISRSAVTAGRFLLCTSAGAPFMICRARPERGGRARSGSLRAARQSSTVTRAIVLSGRGRHTQPGTCSPQCRRDQAGEGTQTSAIRSMRISVFLAAIGALRPGASPDPAGARSRRGRRRAAARAARARSSRSRAAREPAPSCSPARARPARGAGAARRNERRPPTALRARRAGVDQIDAAVEVGVREAPLRDRDLLACRLELADPLAARSRSASSRARFASAVTRCQNASRALGGRRRDPELGRVRERRAGDPSRRARRDPSPTSS